MNTKTFARQTEITYYWQKGGRWSKSDHPRIIAREACRQASPNLEVGVMYADGQDVATVPVSTVAKTSAALVRAGRFLARWHEPNLEITWDESLARDLWDKSGCGTVTTAQDEKRHSIYIQGCVAAFDGKPRDLPLDAIDAQLWGTGYDDALKLMEEREPCSLCGLPTEHCKGGIRAAWYCCPDCVGSAEAEAAGYTHHK